MSRPALLVSLLFVAMACGGTSRPSSSPSSRPSSREPTVAHAAAVTRYTLLPVHLHGGEGRHSASHSSTMLHGTLELAGGRGTLRLDRELTISYVHCDPALQTRQQCAPPDARSSSQAHSIALTGDARWRAGTLHAELTAGRARLTLACSDSQIGLACAVTAHDGLFSPLGRSPQQLAFTSARTHRYALSPIPAGTAEVTGALVISGASATLELAHAGSSHVVPGRLMWTAAGLVVEAGSTLSRITLVCEAPAVALGSFACDVTADRSVVRTADHVYGRTVLVARR